MTEEQRLAKNASIKEAMKATHEKRGAIMAIDIKDKNKTIVHIKNDSFIFDNFETHWKSMCLAYNFYLEKPDIHKDNPTTLYVP